MAKVVGVNDDELSKLLIKITDYSGQLRKLFNDIQDLAEASKSYARFKPMDDWRNGIVSLKSDCDTVINNLSTYKSDLVKIKMLHQDEITNLSKKIRSIAINKGVEHK